LKLCAVYNCSFEDRTGLVAYVHAVLSGNSTLGA